MVEMFLKAMVRISPTTAVTIKTGNQGRRHNIWKTKAATTFAQGFANLSQIEIFAKAITDIICLEKTKSPPAADAAST